MKIYRSFFLLCLGTCGAFSCGDHSHAVQKSLQIKETTKTNYREVEDAERFKSNAFATPESSLSIPLQSQNTAALSHTVPEGWQALPETETRNLNVAIKEHPEVSCYLTLLPERGGDALMNINRWRAQFQLPAITNLSEQESSSVTFMHKDATLYEINGDFKAGNEIKKGFQMLGLIQKEESVAYSIKFIGPAEVILKYKESFLQWVSSIEKEEYEQNRAPFNGTFGLIGWDMPDGWALGEKKTGRIATLTIAAAPNTDCYITVLGGDVLANINRWRQQMNQPPVENLEKQIHEDIETALGSCYFVALEGHFAGGMGAQPINDAALVAGVIHRGTLSVFIKMIGPKSEVTTQIDTFKTFIKSLTEMSE